MGGPRYQHILRAIYETPWAIRPDYLGLIIDIVQFRAAGGLPTRAELDARLSAAQNGPRQGAQRASNVAVIPIYGPISSRQGMMADTSGGTSVDDVRNSLRGALADPAVDAIVFDVDSPGGSVGGVTELAAEIRAARGQKPIVAVANTMAASAAYWLACQAEQVFCTPSGGVGSIGVFAAHHDLSAAYEADGEKVSLISSSISPYKTEGNEYEPLTDEARTDIQRQVDAFGQMFVSDVAKGRGVPVDAVRSQYGKGRVMLAPEALAAGMTDATGTLDDAVRQASRMVATRRAQNAAAGAFTPDFTAGPGSGLPFSDRLALVSAYVGGLVEHAQERADMRAKQGRPAFSDADRVSLRALAGSLTSLATDPDPEPEPDPEPVPDPIPEPPIEAARARARVALALAELGV